MGWILFGDLYEVQESNPQFQSYDKKQKKMQIIGK